MLFRPWQNWFRFVRVLIRGIKTLVQLEEASRVVGKVVSNQKGSNVHPQKTNMEPENRPLEKENPFLGNGHFQVPAISFRGVYISHRINGTGISYLHG